MSHQACQGDCPCCNGACCTESGCVLANCWECTQIHGGLWQGLGTECVDGDCPCDPPADHTQCERCEGGTVSSRCSEGQVCCPPSAGNICCLGQCGECLTNEDCPEGYECFECQCIPIGNCDEDEDCPDDSCCVDWNCAGVLCPTVSTLSINWCLITPSTSGSFLQFGQYDNGNDCMVGGPPPAPVTEVTQYWIKGNATPDEIQEASPSPLYTYPVPGLSNPTGKTCRYVWRVWVGYGPQNYSTPTSDPVLCEGKMYYMYIDVNRCAPTGGSLTAVEDTSYNWGSWPTGCTYPCDTDADSCMGTAPSMTVTFAP